MLRISANYIYPVTSKPLKNGIIEVDKNGTIQKIIDTGGNLRESANLKHYNGVLVPGFINTHCHLELSNKKGLIENVKDLPDFLSQIITIQQNSSLSETEIDIADKSMYNAGIGAVGDISNTNVSFKVKAKSKIQYYNFIELAGLTAKNAINIYNRGVSLEKELYKIYDRKEVFSSIVPHSTYSLSNTLLKLIFSHNTNKKSVLSIHNQESEEENQLFMFNSGRIKSELQKKGVSFDDFISTGKRSFESITNYIPENSQIIFVHNLYTNIEDIKFLSKRKDIKAFFAICPYSNLFIEKKLPDIKLFINNSLNLTIGTDSYASNKTLSILDEMKILIKNFPDISFEDILKWATINGARALNFDNQFGSFETGKTPGINLIINFDFDKQQLRNNSDLIRLI